MHSPFIDDYRLLGIRPGASWKELRAAYREQIRAWHPDRFHDGDVRRRAEAESRSKAINQAYRKLGGYYRQHGCLPLAAEPDTTLRAASADREDIGSGSGTRDPFIERARTVLGRPTTFWTIVGLLLLVSYLALILVAPTGTDAIEPSASVPPPTSDPQSSDDLYFTLGSKLGDVYAVQGVPTKTEKDVWHYHTSKVYFENGAVIRWEATPEHPLKARGDLDPLDATAFTYGFTKAQVRAIQGEPVNETDKAWDYGVSRVYFENGRVVGWSESPINPLRARQ